MQVDEESWGLVRAFTQKATGVVLEPQRGYLLSSRLEPLARIHGLTVKDFVRAATSPSAPSRFAVALVDAITTHETSFFRDSSFWQTLDSLILPELTRRKVPPLRVWSAACSTGQEPYSLTMLLSERWPSVLAGTTVLATDVSEPTLAKARAGSYNSTEVNRGLGAARLMLHLDAIGNELRVRNHIRSPLSWMHHNLLDPQPYPTGFDLVLCRNVLIYFAETDRQVVLNRLMRSIAPGGFLGLGATEIMKGHSVGGGWYRKGGEP